MSIRTRIACTLALLLLLAQGAAGEDAKNTPPKPAAQAAAASVPQGFSSYAAEPAGDNKPNDGRQCVVGAVADADGMNQKPFAYVEDTVANRVLWTRPLELPARTVQGRATHCLRKGGSIYVLLQADTQAAASQSQTLLRVVELDLATGNVTGSREVAMPGVSDATSAWVDKGEEAFHLAGKGAVAVSGEYFRLADPDKHVPFTVTLH